ACSAQSVADPWGSASQTTTLRNPARAVDRQIVEVVLPVPPLVFTKAMILVIETPSLTMAQYNSLFTCARVCMSAYAHVLVCTSELRSFGVELDGVASTRWISK